MKLNIFILLLSLLACSKPNSPQTTTPETSDQKLEQEGQETPKKSLWRMNIIEAYREGMLGPYLGMSALAISPLLLGSAITTAIRAKDRPLFGVRTLEDLMGLPEHFLTEKGYERGKGIAVGVVDSYYQDYHQSPIFQQFKYPLAPSDLENKAKDGVNDHGVHVAGIIGSPKLRSTRKLWNEKRTLGLAPFATIIPLELRGELYGVNGQYYFKDIEPKEFQEKLEQLKTEYSNAHREGQWEPKEDTTWSLKNIQVAYQIYLGLKTDGTVDGKAKSEKTCFYSTLSSILIRCYIIDDNKSLNPVQYQENKKYIESFPWLEPHIFNLSMGPSDKFKPGSVGWALVIPMGRILPTIAFGKIWVISSGNDKKPVFTSELLTQALQDSGHAVALTSTPGVRDYVIMVNNLRRDGLYLDSSSNYVSEVEDQVAFLVAERTLSAPGVDIKSSVIPKYFWQSSYERMSGTSMAAPMVSAALAILGGRYPETPPRIWAQCLLHKATPLVRVATGATYELVQTADAVSEAFKTGDFTQLLIKNLNRPPTREELIKGRLTYGMGRPNIKQALKCVKQYAAANNL